ncbi:unnamed protein product [Aspergillus oryzae RIB40]|nr:unnamed protein product [Aspergillus oryzae RIB40]EIT75605.1 hypothetical protein Ao3042_08130 [Aspergillus oryzae 3.042]KDE84229.1 hypothetical protein AO1008_10792 [Aspergillus oryzae 100-8]BAE66566.1 unnamed protein product [Aspergillus oryzae RIB40]|eukprot:EIT75605.1 hypothetical protein Ao3042_08130 [Aspergillus oryzae 3.042]
MLYYGTSIILSLLCMLTATGGGFALPANLGYFSFFTRLIADSGRANKSLAVFSLTYTLAPHATYPTQIRQAVEALRYVVEQTKFSPGHILLGGDSAGGNLVGGVLSHLAHPHPAIAPVNLSEHLRGAVMIAPWTSMETDFSGQEIDSRGDLITPAVAGPWASAYLGTAKRDYYTDLSTAPADWYSTFPVQKILVCAGGSEILFPIIQDFVKKLKVSFFLACDNSGTSLSNLSRRASRVWSCVLASGRAMSPRSTICISGTRLRRSRGRESRAG